MNYSELQTWRDNQAIEPYSPDTEAPLSPSPWSDAPVPAPDLLDNRGAPQPQQQLSVADIHTAIAQLPPAQRQQAEHAIGMIQDFGRSMLKAGVDKRVVMFAANWLDGLGGKPPKSEPRNHGVDLRAFDFSSKDEAFASSFANFMSRAGATHSDILRMIDWAMAWEKKQHTRQIRQPARPAAQQDFAAQDVRDRAHAELVLKEVWGQSYATNIQAINRYLDGLPKTDREEIETGTLPSGGLQLNNPDFLELLLRKAGSGPSPLAAEISALENRIKTDRKNWFRDDAAQARLRELYRQRDGN